MTAVATTTGTYTWPTGTAPDRDTPVHPCGFKMLVALAPREEKKGAIYMPQDRAEIENRRDICVEVIEQGSACYADRDRYPTGPWCKVGDWVMIASHVGSTPFTLKSDPLKREYRIINEDQPLAVVTNTGELERV